MPTLDSLAANHPVQVRVLFLSTSNSARSQIAEALLEAKGGSRFVVASAGVRPASQVHPRAVRALATLGIDWSGKSPKGFDAVEELEWDFIISTCDPVTEVAPELPGRPVYARWGIPDPAATMGAGREDSFVKTAHLLLWRIDLMLAIRPEVLERTVTTQSLRESRRATRYTAESVRTFTEPAITRP